jgi:hypothetical protein
MITTSPDEVLGALDKLDVKLSPAEEARIKAFFNQNPRISPIAASAIANTLNAISDTPAGVASLLTKDLRDFMTPVYGHEFVQRLNQDEAILINDINNAMQRHMRESGMVPLARPISEDNPATQPHMTLEDAAPSEVGYDYNRRPQGGTASVIPKQVSPGQLLSEHDSALETRATSPAAGKALVEQANDDKTQPNEKPGDGTAAKVGARPGESGTMGGVEGTGKRLG